MTEAQVASLLKDHDAQKEEKDHEKEELMKEIRVVASAIVRPPCQGATVASSAVRQVKPASVGGSTTAATGTYDRGTDEAAIDFLVEKFGSRFANISSKTKRKKTNG